MLLIDKQVLKDAIGVDCYEHYSLNHGSSEYAMLETVYEVIDQCPTIDPVHAAGGCYCQECERWEPDGSYGLDLDGVRHPYGACNATHCFSRDDHFCGHGRQKETQK